MRLPVFSMLLSLMLSLIALPAQAERYKAFDHYQIHYNAFNSSFLPPEVAKAYAIQRSKVRGLINVAVLDSDNSNKPVDAVVSGEIRNLVGQTQQLSFQKISEGEAVYYIAEFRFTDDEILNFNLQVQPDPNQSAHQIEFKQHFYTD